VSVVSGYGAFRVVCVLRDRASVGHGPSIDAVRAGRTCISQQARNHRAHQHPTPDARSAQTGSTEGNIRRLR